MLNSLTLAAVLALPADSILLRVLTINDFHGALEAKGYAWSNGRPIGGIAAVKGMMDSLAGECRCPSIRLDAGDQLQGTLTSNLVAGRSAVEAMNLLGLTAAVIGNHELDWGVDTLMARISEARYPWLAVNIIDTATSRRPAWSKPYAIVSAGPYRIGVVGYLAPATKTMVMDRHVRGLRFPEGMASMAETLALVKAARPDFTMLVAHEGAFCDSLACTGEIIDLARQTDSTVFDLIVAGHTHTLLNTVVNGIPIVSARSSGTAIGIADLVRSPDGGRRWRVRVESVYADAVSLDSAAVALVDRYRPLIGRLANQVVARLRDTLLVERGEYPIGNLIADAQRAAAPADFGLMNNGGIRRALLPGPVTYADLFELQPFGNNVVRLSMPGRELKRVLEHSLRDGAPNAHISGLKVRYDPSRPPGDQVVEIRKLDGTRIDPRRLYVLAVADFLAGGGGGYAMLRQYRQIRTGKTDLEAIIAWAKRLPQPIRAPAGKRWQAVTK